MYSDNKREIKYRNGKNNKIKGNNLFNKIQQMFNEDSQDDNNENNESGINYENNVFIQQNTGKESYIKEKENIEDEIYNEE